MQKQQTAQQIATQFGLHLSVYTPTRKGVIEGALSGIDATDLAVVRDALADEGIEVGLTTTFRDASPPKSKHKLPALYSVAVVLS